MACKSQILAGINAICDCSKGGIVKVYVGNYGDFVPSLNNASGQTTAATYGMITGVTLASGATKMKTYKFRKNTGSMTSTLTLDEANGVSYVETELQMLFTRMETPKRMEMAALALGELVCIVKDSNGLFWYLGFDEGVTASAGTGQTGQNKTDGNYYQITLKDSADSYPYQVDSAAITSSFIDDPELGE